VPTWQDWSAEQSSGGKIVAVDPKLITGATAKKLSEKVKRSGGSELKALDENLVDLVWGEARPPRPSEPVSVLLQKFSGKDISVKLAELRQELSKKSASGFLISMLDEIAWLFNLRGNDIPYNPVFFSYALVTQDAATLYIDESKLGPECKDHLAANNVSVKLYDQVFADAEALCMHITEQTADVSQGHRRSMISTKASWALKRALGGDVMVDEVRSPVGDSKAVKNETEMAGMRACHVRDGVALIEFFAWLEDQLVVKQAVIDEVAAADQLEQFRFKQKDFVGLSFDTISATGPK
jgi:Xaa-Pro aminopeptidase